MTGTFPMGRHLRGRVRPSGCVEVLNRRGQLLGEIGWNANWQCHEFEATPGACFTADCLGPIAETLRNLDREKRGNPA